MSTQNAHAYILQLTAATVPSMRYDGIQPFDAWQHTAREKLGELLGLPLLKGSDEIHILRKSRGESFTRTDFTFESEPGYEVSAAFLCPDNMQQPLPVVICLQGHSTGMHISLGEPHYERDAKSIAGGRDIALQAIRNGYCAVAIEQRYMGTSGHGETGQPSCQTHNESTAALMLGRTAVGERVWDVSRLIDILCLHFADVIDSTRIACMGNSSGGTTTYYAACMDERIHLAIPSCSVASYDQSIMAIYHCPCNFVPNIRRYFDMGDLGGLIAPRPVIVVCGVEDPIFPLPGVHKGFDDIRGAYTHLQLEENCRLVEGNGGHRFYPDETWPLARRMLQK